MKAKVLVHTKTGEYGVFSGLDDLEICTASLPQLFPLTSNMEALKNYFNAYSPNFNLDNWVMKEVEITIISN